MPNEDASKPCDLFKRQNLSAGQERIIRSKDFLGHAIHTTKVAPVRNGNAQVAQRTVEGIGQSHQKSLRFTIIQLHESLARHPAGNGVNLQSKHQLP
jgi:hypothetical protein